MNHQEPQVLELESCVVKNPLVVLGFVEMTNLGLLTSSYIIETEQLHQVAQIKSIHIPPVTVFVGGKMRSPFRIYVNKEGTLVVITCEVPIDDEGLYEISSVLVKWVEGLKPKEMVVIEGIPVKDDSIPKSVYAATESTILKKFSDVGVKIANSAIISGIGGAMMNESLGKKIKTVSLMVPNSIQAPDPEAVLAIISLLNKVYGTSIKTDLLEESVKKLHDEANQVMDKYNEIQTNKAQEHERSIYG